MSLTTCNPLTTRQSANRYVPTRTIPIALNALLLLTLSACTGEDDGNASPTPRFDWGAVDNADFSLLSMRCFKADGTACDAPLSADFSFSLAQIQSSTASSKGNANRDSAGDSNTDICTVKGGDNPPVTCSSQVIPRLNGPDWFSISMMGTGMKPERCVATSLGDPALNKYVNTGWYKGLVSEGTLPPKVDNPLTVEHCDPLAGPSADPADPNSVFSTPHNTLCPWPMSGKDYDLVDYYHQYGAPYTDATHQIDTLLSMCPTGTSDVTTGSSYNAVCRSSLVTAFYAAWNINRSERVIIACETGSTDQPYAVGIASFPLAGDPNSIGTASAESACEKWPAWQPFADTDTDGAPQLSSPQSLSNQHSMSLKAQELGTLGCYPVPPHLEVLGSAAGIKPEHSGYKDKTSVVPSVRECNDDSDHDGAAQSGYIVERCDDGIDNDCDGDVDETDCTHVALSCDSQALDSDEDDYASADTLAGDRPNFCEEVVSSTNVPIRLDYRFYTPRNEPDCDDFNASFHPGAEDHCDGHDDDCDGEIDEDGDEHGNKCKDEDNDGSPSPADCDDHNASVHPGATEQCNGIDDDCDGDIDESFTDTDSDGEANCADIDDDDDGTEDNDDNCSLTFNPDQANLDDDELGDACDADVDGDGEGAPGDCDDYDSDINSSAIEVCDGIDNDCDGSIDEESPDIDHDGEADCVDPDDDGDGVPDLQDNCPTTSNTDQKDSDGDKIGEACDACPQDASNDIDKDGVCGNVDNCPNTYNPTQANFDGDALGDSCDSCLQDAANDLDSDGVCGNVDNCPTVSNTDQKDSDADKIGDACDTCSQDSANDADKDGICGNVDNCPTVSNTDQKDSDGDGIGDACDGETCDGLDNNNNGQIDEGFVDSDHDGKADCVDPDDDNDGDPDSTDCKPLDASISHNAIEQCDGIDNDCDMLIDEGFTDTDQDGISDCVDPDDDNDKDLDSTDCKPLDASISHNATEICDPSNTDEDCDGLADDKDPNAVGKMTWYMDADADGYGDSASPVTACDASSVTKTYDAISRLSHLIGRADGDGWSASPELDPVGYLSYGPYEALPSGATTVQFKLLIDQNAGDSKAVAYIDVHDYSSNRIIASKDLLRTDFSAKNAYQTFQLSYLQEAGHVMEFRVYWYDIAYIRQKEVMARSAGTVANAADCNDKNPTAYPGATELCDGIDNDCDTLVDEGSTDTDKDGIADCIDSDDDNDSDPDSTDCKPLDATISHNATEKCDGIDNDCDTLVDEGSTDTDKDGIADCVDSDDDNDGDPDSTDCKPLDATIFHNATEKCDGLDNDCDTLVDEGSTDTDKDGIADCADSDDDNDGDPDSTDCKPLDATIYHNAAEKCDGIDNDCDGNIDDTDSNVTGRNTWYRDQDADAYPYQLATTVACNQPSGYIPARSDGKWDCVDTNPAINPGAQEVCNGLDDDCDLAIDDNDSSVTGRKTWYRDQDADAYPYQLTTTIACSQPSGYILARGDGKWDCVDTDALVYPDQAELTANGKDDNCDGIVDACPGTSSIYFLDNDGDGFGQESSFVRACSVPPGYSESRGDCDDTPTTGVSTHPGAYDKSGDGADQDCGGADGQQPTLGLAYGTAASIKSALSASVSGTVIWVGPGTYTGDSLSFGGKTVKLKSTQLEDRTKIDAGGKDYVFLDAGVGAGAGLDGFTLQGSVTAALTISSLYRDQTGVSNLTISGNAGVGLVLRYSSAADNVAPSVTRLKIVDNDGYGVSATGGTSSNGYAIVLTNAQIERNYGGIFVSAGTQFACRNCYVHNNDNDGVNLEVKTASPYYGTALLFSSEISHNHRYGVYGGNLSFTNCLITDNDFEAVYLANGAMYSDGTTRALGMATMTNTTVVFGGSNAVYVGIYDWMKLTSSIIVGTVLDSNSGSIPVSNSDLYGYWTSWSKVTGSYIKVDPGFVEGYHVTAPELLSSGVPTMGNYSGTSAGQSDMDQDGYPDYYWGGYCEDKPAGVSGAIGAPWDCNDHDLDMVYP